MEVDERNGAENKDDSNAASSEDPREEATVSDFPTEEEMPAANSAATPPIEPSADSNAVSSEEPRKKAIVSDFPAEEEMPAADSKATPPIEPSASNLPTQSRSDGPRWALIIELAMLILAIGGLVVSIFQLQQAIRDSRATESILTKIVSVLVEEVEISNKVFELKSASAVDGPEATANAKQLETLRATQAALEYERDFLLSSLRPPPMPTCPDRKVKITEIMTIPIAPGADENKERWNEYVELHNHGQGAIDVGGWWIADRHGHAGLLIPWNERYTGIPVGSAQTDSSLISPGGFAVILPPTYDRGNKPYDQEIPGETIVLTISEGDYIGNGIVGLQGEVLDVLVLYSGSETEIKCKISTYGTPIEDLEGLPPSSIEDDQADEIPKGIPKDGGWGGYRRVFLGGVDTQSNWSRFYWEQRSPGYDSSE